MRTISTGQPSTLKTYLGIARFFGPKAVAFIEQKIAESPSGEDEEVIADERQVLYLFAQMAASQTDDPEAATTEPDPYVDFQFTENPSPGQ